MRYRHLVAAAAVALLVTSCSKGEDSPPPPGVVREPPMVAYLPYVIKVDGMQRGEGGKT